MGLNKVTYVDGSTVITAANLNDIQDAVIDLEATRNVPTNVRTAIYTLLENAAYVTTGLEDEIAIVEAWAEEVTSLTLSASTLSLNQDIPQTLTATTVPSGIAVAWTSSDSSVATVSDGVVTGVANGSCTITASAGDLSATCEVTVSGFVELVSIAAVYTQSGTVYDTDSLDSLKADLVVTATYSDSTTATVTTYTLSGTLEVGTSTITVAYGGKTTTFTVTVTLMVLYNYSYTGGTLNIDKESVSWDETHDIFVNNSSMQQGRRRSISIDNGVKPYFTTVDTVTYNVTNPPKYPISIPQDATSCTYSVTPNTQFAGAAFYSYDSQTNKYTRVTDVGWKQGSYTHTFTAGSVQYMTCAIKYNSTGTSYPTEPTEFTIEFLTE